MWAAVLKKKKKKTLLSLAKTTTEIQNRRVPKEPNIDFKAFSLFGSKAKLVVIKAELLVGIEHNLLSSRFLALCSMF